MFPAYRKIQNVIAYKHLARNPLIPEYALATGDDEKLSSVPLMIFKDQHQPAGKVQMIDPKMIPYEKAAVKGANDHVQLEDFETHDFNIGDPMGQI